MEYFYVPPHAIRGNTVEIVGEEQNHLVHVMRRGPGDGIRVVDGLGNAYDVTLTRIKKKIALGTITRHLSNHNEPDLTVHVAVGVLKNPSKFDFLVEKVTELGVKKIIPLATERSIPKQAKVGRWQKLALAAMKQCGRSYLPKVEELKTLSNVLQGVHSYGCAVVCHETTKDARQISDVCRLNSEPILLLIGPEGGFSEEEFQLCREAGCVAASLGNRRLRTETAAIVAATLALLD
jgi:16S rRNA (uracil1498-N3)-methyltransferase